MHQAHTSKPSSCKIHTQMHTHARTHTRQTDRYTHTDAHTQGRARTHTHTNTSPRPPCVVSAHLRDLWNQLERSPYSRNVDPTVLATIVLCFAFDSTLSQHTTRTPGFCCSQPFAFAISTLQGREQEHFSVKRRALQQAVHFDEIGRPRTQGSVETCTRAAVRPHCQHVAIGKVNKNTRQC